MRDIQVTKTFLPPFEEYKAYLERIWESGQLTNEGPLLKKFESRAKHYLQVDNFQFVANGTMALQLSLEALGIREGEIITTPFSYVATTSSILWQRCKPVYVDIDPTTLNIDPSKIEDAITSETKAIMPVHVFGNPCDVENIDEIAKKYKLNVIYDAAHAFGVKYKGKSLLDYGDISVCSFHATKLFHTIEGGCVVSKKEKTNEAVELKKRFGHNKDNHVMLGVNAKASEFQAAMGLCNLNYVDENISKRRKIFDLYERLLEEKLQKLIINEYATYNYGYYPVILDNETILLQKMEMLEKDNIFPRRYFYPSLNTLPYIEGTQSCPISEDISRRILCLPIYVGLEEEIIAKVCKVIES